MTRIHPALRRSRFLPVATAVAAIGTVAALISSGSAGADMPSHGGPVPPPPAVPTSANQIQNIDQVRTAIKGYYGDTVTTDIDPVPNTIDGGDKVLHTFSPDSNYAKEMAGVEADAIRYLAHFAKVGMAGGTPAVLFDVDDTTLNTFNYEIYSNFAYNPTTNGYFVNGAAFPATPGMVAVEKAAEDMGYTVFFLTGRPLGQHDGTVTNLTNVGYDVVDANLYLKDASGVTERWLSSCAPTCTTIQYKSLTRQHIESLGYDIVANFGDQYSDLLGGFANETFKLPNPMYYLP
jgi:hypothetical protein